MKKWFGSCILLLVIVSLGACGKSIAAQVAEQLELGQKYLLEQEYEEAIVAFNKAIELEPSTREAYYGLGQSYEGLASLAGENSREEKAGYYAQAEEAYFQVLKLDTLDHDACRRLISIYENLGELEKLANLSSYYYGEATDIELIRQIERAKVCLDMIQQIARLCEEGNVDSVFTLLQSEEYQILKELSVQMNSPVFIVGDGIGIGLYTVNTTRYGVNQFGDFMIYYGGFANDLRQGHGLWIGYDNENNYYASGEWSDDQPNGEQEVREWFGLLAEDVVVRLVRGTVVNGLWNGPVQWSFEEADGTVETYPVSFTNGKWNVLEVMEDDNGKSYRVSEPINEGDIMSTSHPEFIEGIVGFLPDFESEGINLNE